MTAKTSLEHAGYTYSAAAKVAQHPGGLIDDVATLRASHTDLLAALRLFVNHSMGEVRPAKGESFIGWQRGDGLTANERVAIARAAIARATEA